MGTGFFLLHCLPLFAHNNPTMATKHCTECDKPFTRPNSWGWCERCWPFNYDPASFKEHHEQNIEQGKSLKKELGIPANVQTNRSPFSGAWIDDKWIGYYFEFYGVVIKPVPTETPPGVLIYFTNPEDPRNDWVEQLWQQKVTHDNTSVYGEVRWHPKRGERASLQGLEHAKGKADIDLIWRGLKQLPSVREEVKRGRPFGSVSYDLDTFLNRSIKAYQDLHLNLDKLPTQYDVAAELRLGRATFNRLLKTYGISWQQIRNSAGK